MTRTLLPNLTANGTPFVSQPRVDDGAPLDPATTVARKSDSLAAPGFVSATFAPRPEPVAPPLANAPAVRLADPGTLKPFRYCANPIGTEIRKICLITPRVFLHTFVRPIQEIYALDSVQDMLAAHCRKDAPALPDRFSMEPVTGDYAAENLIVVGDHVVAVHVFDNQVSQALRIELFADLMRQAQNGKSHEGFALLLNSAQQGANVSLRFLTITATYDSRIASFNFFCGLSDYDRRLRNLLIASIEYAQADFLFRQSRQEGLIPSR